MYTSFGKFGVLTSCSVAFNLSNFVCKNSYVY